MADGAPKSGKCRGGRALLRYLGRATAGAVAGSVLALVGTACTTYAMYLARGGTREALDELPPGRLTTILVGGATAGAVLAAGVGGLRLPPATRYVARGVLAGVGVVTLFGLFANCAAGEKSGVGLWWLMYGDPVGAVVGGILGWRAWRATRPETPDQPL